MNRIAGTIIVVAMLVTPGLAAADMAASRTNESTPATVHEKHDGNHGAKGSGTNGRPTHEHRPYEHHRHRVIAIYIYVPEIRPVNAPYYYVPDTPVYIEQDPPEGAYREVNGFYYWCNDPAGYYPFQPDCPTGWRLVAP